MFAASSSSIMPRRHVSFKLLGSIFVGICFLFLSACGSPPKRPAYNGTDSVAAVPPTAFVGTWSYTVLNPVQPEENGNDAVYTFNADGSWIATANTRKNSPEFPLDMESTGRWAVSGERVQMTMESVRETSGSQLGGFMVSLMEGMFKRQTGDMNPYSIAPNQIVMFSEKHGQAIQMDRIK